MKDKKVFWNFRGNPCTVIPLSCFAALIVNTLAGCATPATTQKEERVESKTAEALHTYEKTFNPADYDPEIPFEPPEEKEVRPITPAPAVETEAEVVPGFRVQVTFTDNIEQANMIKNEVALLFTDQTVYVVYEAPYYKVRVGDFLNRIDANPTMRLLFENGYKDSWIVPDKVRKQ